jgi:PAS domain S-box-containing protein
VHVSLRPIRLLAAAFLLLSVDAAGDAAAQSTAASQEGAVVSDFMAAHAGPAERRAARAGAVFVAASSNNFPPINFLDIEGELTGFSRDVTEAVIEAVGGEVRHVHSGLWPEVEAALVEGRADFLQDVAISPGRDRRVDFTEPILVMHEEIFVATDSTITGFDDLHGRTVACVTGHITERFLRTIADITCLQHDTPQQAIRSVVEGRADALVYPNEVAEDLVYQMHLESLLRVVGSPVRRLEYAMAVRSGDTEMLDLLNGGIAAIRGDGTLHAITQRWFGRALERGVSLQTVLWYSLGAAALVIALALLLVYELRTNRRLNAAVRAQELLSRCNELVIRADDERRLLEDVCRLLVDTGGYRMAWVGFAEPQTEDGRRPVRPVAEAGFGAGYLESLQVSWDDSDSGRGPTGSAIRSGRPAVFQDILRDPRFAPWRERARQRGYASSVALPLATGGRPFGALNIYSSRPRAFLPAEVDLLNRLCGDLAFGINSLRDSAALRDAEAAAHDSEYRVRLLLESTAEAIIGVDAETRIVFANAAALRTLGMDSPDGLLGRPLHAALHTEQAGVGPIASASCPLCQAITAGRPVHGEDLLLTAREAEGGMPIEYWSHPVVNQDALSGAVVTFLDISERRTAEAQYRQAQKMEVVGQLTGGIAHDFNNLLAVVMGNLELLEERLPSDGAERTLVTQALKAADRGAALTGRLLAFSRRQHLRPQLVDLNAQIGEVVGLMRRTLGERVEIETRLGPALWPCRIDPGQFESAVLNLAVNARDAMPNGGIVTIGTENIVLDRPRQTRPQTLGPGRYVRVTVADTGEGMPADVAARAFEPFFTTKGLGKGSGLGLSMVYGFARQSGGSVEIASEPGRGTEIRLYFPRAKAFEDAAAQPAETAPCEPTPGARVLVVEDDPEVRASAEQIVAELGYGVRAAKDADEAMAALEADPAFDLLFTDMVLPGPVDGPELARLAIERRPGLKVLFTSGYAADQAKATAPLGTGCRAGFIAKPFRKADLARKLADLLQPAEAGGIEAAV